MTVARAATLIALFVAGLAVSGSLPLAGAVDTTGVTTLELVASGLAYDKAALQAPAGTVTISMRNDSPIEHNVALRGTGVDLLGAVVGPGGTSSITAELPPGTYEFYCSVPGHADSGMRGTLAVTSPPTTGTTPVAPPANDDFAAAESLTGSAGGATGSSAGATKEPEEPDHAANPGGASVWYRWKAPAAGTVTFDTFGSDFDTLLAVYTGTRIGGLTLVAANDDAGTGNRSRAGFTAELGAVYHVAVDGFAGGTGRVVLSWNAPPPHDAFASAQALSGSAGTVSGGNAGATTEAGEPPHSGNPGGASVWYRWRAPASGTVTFDTVGSDFDTLLAVYTGASLETLSRVASDDESGGAGASRLRFEATSDTVYHVAVDGFGGATGRAVLSWNPPPANDAFGSAQALTGPSGRASGTTAGATKEAGEPDHAGNPGGASVWYSWQAPSSGTATFASAGSSFDTLVAVYTGASLAALTPVASANAGSSSVTFSAAAGGVYRIALDGAGGARGGYALSWNGPAPPAPPPAGGGGGASTELQLVASGLAFDRTSLQAPAGTVRITMRNDSPLQHNVAIRGNGVDVVGPIVGAGGTSTVTAELAPGTYEFYCSVPGHAGAGMTGTLLVGGVDAPPAPPGSTTTTAGGTTTPGGGGGGAHVVAQGLSFRPSALHAAAGTVTISMRNDSPLDHNVAIRGNGVDVAGPVVGRGGISTVTAELAPGTYEFYCSVPGHADAGMKGTLIVAGGDGQPPAPAPAAESATTTTGAVAGAERTALPRLRLACPRSLSFTLNGRLAAAGPRSLSMRVTAAKARSASERRRAGGLLRKKVTVLLAASTKIARDGKPVALSDLRPGDRLTLQVRLCRVNGRAPLRLVARTVAARAASPAALGGLQLVATGLKFDKTTLQARAGKVTITLRNDSPLPHNVAIRGNGIDAKGPVVQRAGTSSVTAEVAAGRYEFYCSVPGHAAAGMKGTLTVTP